MPDEIRLQLLLEQLLEDERTPEEVCAADPDLLPEVRARWARVRRIAGQLDELFPDSDARTRPAAEDTETELPRIAGYEVEAVLGRGGMGVVFKARQIRPNRPVALKMLLAGGYAGARERARFLREVEAAARLRHPNIVSIYEAGEYDGRPYFTMELIEGGTLAQQLARELPTPRRAAELVGALAVTVQFAHTSGVIHRDLKPANILLTGPLADGANSGGGNLRALPPSESWGALKIADFGLARFLGAEPELTRTGARLGTPSYMAPEQALGKTGEIGPAVDVYALGAILYETLTGSPPFAGPNSVETERRVISEEPAQPSHANPNVPRDLETICLKCLHKIPARRYASARDLADDLHRFLDGKPITARPVGAIERGAKWARRHPTSTAVAAALLVVLVTMIGLGVWIDHQRRTRQTEQVQREQQAHQRIETAIDKAYEAARAERWDEAHRTLANVRGQLADANSQELEARLSRAEADINFAQELDRIRQSVTLAGVEDQFAGPLFSVGAGPAKGTPTSAPSRLLSEYTAAFARWGYSFDGAEKEAATRWQASPLRAHTVAALDQWAFAAFTLGRLELCTKLLRIVRAIDPDPNWGDAFRDEDCWRDDRRLRALVADAARASRFAAPHQLGIVASLLRSRGDTVRATALLEEALRSRPADFWLNWEVASLHSATKEYTEAVGYLRSLVALRPESAWTHFHLALGLARTDHRAASIATFYEALARAPDDRVIRESLVLQLWWEKRSEEALAVYQRAIDQRPNDADIFDALGILYFRLGRFSDAVSAYRRAVELDPTRTTAYCNLGTALAQLGRYEEALGPYSKTIELEPGSTVGHHGRGLVFLDLKKYPEAIAEFRWVIARVDPKPPLDPDAKIDHLCVASRQAMADALLALGRCTEAVEVAKTALDFPVVEEDRRKDLTRHLALGQRLIPLEARLPALLAGEEQPADARARLAFAEWLLWHKHRPARATREYQLAFEQDPASANDLEAGHRLNAARSAALAGSGYADGAQLTAEERAVSRAQALDWLRADFAAWNKRHQGATSAVQSATAHAVAEWLSDVRLHFVRDETFVAKLPAKEGAEWRQFWSDVARLAARDPVQRFAQARAHAARKEWTRAAEMYNAVLTDVPTSNSHVWFEAAAVRLLSGDAEGYRQACKCLLSRAVNPSVVRPYIAARACTLAAESGEDLARVSWNCESELQKFATTFWSLTEQGALQYRANRYQQAVTLFEKSLRADAKPGNAVLNWLWLAMAHHKLGHQAEAGFWLERARVWLDSHGDAMPKNAPALGLHEHNWLEAHVLLREAEALIGPQKGAPPKR
jgi:serine/threonine-protein kinase